MLVDPSFLQSVNVSVLPRTTDEYDLGSTSLKWNGIYVSNVYGIPLLPETVPAEANLKSLINKEYVDLAVTSLGASYYMWDTDDPTGYKTCYLEPSSGSETYIEASGLVDDQYIAGWISAEGEEPAVLLKGVHNWYVTLEKTTGTKTLRVYWKLYERLSDDSEVEVATSSESNEIDEKSTYIVPLQLDSDYTPSDGSRIVGKLFARVSGSGNAPTIRVYYQGNTSSRWEIPANTEIFQNIFVPYTGVRQDVDLGSHTITSDSYANLGSLRIGGLEVINSSRVIKNITSQTLLPDEDGTRDLGSSSYKWRDVYIGGALQVFGEANFHNLDLKNVNAVLITDIGANEGIIFQFGSIDMTIWTTSQGGENAFMIRTTSTYPFKFRMDGTDKLEISDAIKPSLDVVPTTHNFYDLGSSSFRWKNFYLSGLINNIPYETLMIYEDMETAPAGTLKGVAYYDATNKWVRLTEAVNGQTGHLEYNIRPGDAFIVEFEFWSGGGTGADAIWVYAFATSTPITEESVDGGYQFVYDEYNDEIQLVYNGTKLTAVSQTGIDNSTWHKARIVFFKDWIRIYYDGNLKIDYHDTDRAITGTLFGFGARTGGLNNEHRIRNIKVYKFTGTDWTSININLLPDEDGVRNLGSSSFRWKNGYFSGDLWIFDLHLRQDNTRIVGGNHLVLFASDVEYLRCRGTERIIESLTFIPKADETYSLGDSTHKWNELYLDKLAGSILFSDGAKLTEDNTNLFWDNTNKRLGIGTPSPSSKLSITCVSDYGIKITSSYNAYYNAVDIVNQRGDYPGFRYKVTGGSGDFISHNVLFEDNRPDTTGSVGPFFTIYRSGSLTKGSLLRVGVDSNIHDLVVSNEGKVGIDTSVPSAKLDVLGAAIRAQSSGATPIRPGTGIGVEMEYAGDDDKGVIRSYDRDATAYKPLEIDGSYLVLNAAGGGSVGIGMVPSVKLDIAGALRASDYANIGSLQIGGTEIVTSSRVLQNVVSIAQTLLPDDDNTRDLGSSSFRWKNGYFAGDIALSDGKILSGFCDRAGTFKIMGIFDPDHFEGGVSNAGEFEYKPLPGHSKIYVVTPEGTEIAIRYTSTEYAGNAAQDSYAGEVFTMFSEQLVNSERGFSAYDDTHFVIVRYYNGQWQYDNNDTWITFTPLDSDILVHRVIRGTGGSYDSWQYLGIPLKQYEKLRYLIDSYNISIGGTEVLTSGRVLQNVTADAEIITSGIFDVARIPDLDASKIATGVFDLARIPSLDWTRMPFGAWSELLTQIGNTVGDYLNLSYLQIGGSTVLTSGKILQNIASVAQNLLPDDDNTRDLGSLSNRWKNGHFANIVVAGTYVDGIGGGGIIAGPTGGGRHLIINDISGARWALGTGGYDLHIYKHKSDTDTWEEALRLEGDTANNYPLGVSVAGFVRPVDDSTHDLGALGYRWRNIWLSGYVVFADNSHRRGKLRLWKESNLDDSYVSHAIGTEAFHNTYGPGESYANSVGHKFYVHGTELAAQIGVGGTGTPTNRKNSTFYGDVSFQSGVYMYSLPDKTGDL